MKDSPIIKSLCYTIDRAHQALCDELQKEIDKRMKVLNSIRMLRTLRFVTGMGTNFFTLEKRDKKIKEYRTTHIVDHNWNLTIWMKKRWPLMEEICEIDNRMDSVARWDTGEK